MTTPRTLAQWLVTLIVLLAAIAIAVAAAREFGFVIPAFFWTVLWVLLVASVAILALKWLFGLGNTE